MFEEYVCGLFLSQVIIPVEDRNSSRALMKGRSFSAEGLYIPSIALRVLKVYDGPCMAVAVLRIAIV